MLRLDMPANLPPCHHITIGRGLCRIPYGWPAEGVGCLCFSHVKPFWLPGLQQRLMNSRKVPSQQSSSSWPYHSEGAGSFRDCPSIRDFKSKNAICGLLWTLQEAWL